MFWHSFTPFSHIVSKTKHIICLCIKFHNIIEVNIVDATTQETCPNCGKNISKGYISEIVYNKIITRFRFMIISTIYRDVFCKSWEQFLTFYFVFFCHICKNFSRAQESPQIEFPKLDPNDLIDEIPPSTTFDKKQEGLVWVAVCNHICKNFSTTI